MTAAEAPAAGRQPAAYRADIDGLRAIAVLSVVFFHAGGAFAPGGYVGVDVFFVISGYLISNILFRELEAGRYSIPRFYERRVRRIFPALFAVVTVTLAVGLVILTPPELDDLGKSAFAAALFYSNYHFMFDVGYFDAPAEAKALLHTWSLAVEEQFYIVFPLLLWAAHAVARRRLSVVIWGLLAASFVYAVWLVPRDADSAFFSAPARTWELMAGAALSICLRDVAPSKMWAEMLGLIGLALIGYAIFGYAATTRFPGIAAAPPVLGAALILVSGRTSGTLVASALSVAPMRFFGLISYSLYLWHWPVLVLWGVYRIEPVGEAETAVLILAMIVLATLSWRYVETPMRSGMGARLSRRVVLCAGGAAILAVGAAGAGLALSNGLPQRLTKDERRMLAARSDREIPRRNCETFDKGAPAEIVVCAIGDLSIDGPNFLFAGDSHGEAMRPAIDEAAKLSGRRGVYVGRPGCAPLIGVRRKEAAFATCAAFGGALAAYLDRRPEIRDVILSANWAAFVHGVPFAVERGVTTLIEDDQTRSHSVAENQRVFRDGLDRTLAAFASPGRRIVVIDQTPEAAVNIPNSAARLSMSGRVLELRPARAAYDARNELAHDLFAAAAMKTPFTVAPVADAFCSSDWCEVMDGPIPRYRDSSHLSATFARSLGPQFTGLFE